MCTIITRSTIPAFLFLLSSIVLPCPASSQYVFGTDVRVNDDPPGTNGHLTVSSGQHSVAVSGDTVYVVWQDSRDGIAGIYFARSLDGGSSFSPNVDVDDLSYGKRPCLSLTSDGHVVVAWVDRRASSLYTDIYVDLSLDGGITFGEDLRVDLGEPGEFKDNAVSLATSSVDPKVYVAWTHGTPDYLTELHLTRSVDGGVTFCSPYRVDDGGTGLIGYASCPSLAVGSSMGNKDLVVLGWREDEADLPPRSRVSVSSDCASTFAPSVWVSAPYWRGILNSLTISYESGIVDAYTGSVEEDTAIYVATSKDGGISYDENLVAQESGEPSVALGPNGGIYVVWSALWPSPQRIMFSHSTDGGRNFSTPIVVNDTSWPAAHPSIAVGDDARVYIMWTDYRWGGGWGDICMDVGCPAVGIENEESEGADLAFGSEDILSISPNPFSRSTTISFSVPSESENAPLSLAIFDVRGRLVSQLIEGFATPGVHSQSWGSHRTKFRSHGSAVYYVRLKIGDLVHVRRLLELQ